MWPASVLGMFVFAVSLPSSCDADQDSSLVAAKGIGIDVGFAAVSVNAPEIVDYMNLSFNPTQQVDVFTTAMQFSAGVSWFHPESWIVRLEYATLFYSDAATIAQVADIPWSYHVHMPMLLALRMIEFPTYYLAIGGGAGYHVGTFMQRIPPGSDQEFRSRGIGIRFEAKGGTQLENRFYGVVAVFMQKNVMGALRDAAGKSLVLPQTGRSASLDFFSVGLKFGFHYFF